MMSTRTSDAPPSSPLDPYFAPFLEHVATLASGYSPLSHDRQIAEALAWEPEFVSVVYTSARARGMLEPFRSKEARGRNRWRLSPRGARWVLDRRADASPTAAP